MVHRSKPLCRMCAAGRTHEKTPTRREAVGVQEDAVTSHDDDPARMALR